MLLCRFPPLQNHSEITMYKLPFCQQNDATLHSFPVHLEKQRRKWLRESQMDSEGKEIMCQKTFP